MSGSVTQGQLRTCGAPVTGFEIDIWNGQHFREERGRAEHATLARRLRAAGGCGGRRRVRLLRRTPWSRTSARATATDVVDLAISTHPDADHINGLTHVVEQLTVTEMWLHQPDLHGYTHDDTGIGAVRGLRAAAIANGTLVVEPFPGRHRDRRDGAGARPRRAVLTRPCCTNRCTGRRLWPRPSGCWPRHRSRQ